MLCDVGGVLRKAKKDTLSVKSFVLSDKEVVAESQSGAHRQIQLNTLWKYAKS